MSYYSGEQSLFNGDFKDSWQDQIAYLPSLDTTKLLNVINGIQPEASNIDLMDIYNNLDANRQMQDVNPFSQSVPMPVIANNYYDRPSYDYFDQRNNSNIDMFIPSQTNNAQTEMLDCIDRPMPQNRISSNPYAQPNQLLDIFAPNPNVLPPYQQTNRISSRNQCAVSDLECQVQQPYMPQYDVFFDANCDEAYQNNNCDDID